MKNESCDIRKKRTAQLIVVFVILLVLNGSSSGVSLQRLTAEDRSQPRAIQVHTLQIEVYGGTQMAMSLGVPLVIAGAIENKTEVAARVEWAGGVGINLENQKRSPNEI